MERPELSDPEKNAIRFLVALSGFLILAGIAGSRAGPYVGLFAAAFFFYFPLFVGVAAPGFYEMTMRGSIPVLKASLLIALLLALASAVTGSVPLALFAVVFTISPVFYDFFRDILFQQVPREVPWHERRLGTRMLELLVESAMSAIIGLALTLLLSGHL